MHPSQDIIFTTWDEWTESKAPIRLAQATSTALPLSSDLVIYYKGQTEWSDAITLGKFMPNVPMNVLYEMASKRT